MNITLKNGEVREYAPGTTAMDIIADIGEGLARGPWRRASTTGPSI